jgi:hypothetical protein
MLSIKLKRVSNLMEKKSYGVLNKDNEGKDSDVYDIQEGDPELGSPSFEFIEVPPLDLPAKTMILDQ